MKNLRLAIFLAFKDMFNNLGSLLFVSAALGFLFANVLFARFMLYGFETAIGNLIPKVSGQIYVKPERGQSYIYDTDKVISKTKGRDSIVSMTPHLEMPCVLDYNKSRMVTMVWGLDFNEDVMQVKEHVIEGRYFTDSHAKEIILGKILKKRFNLKLPLDKQIKIGDTVECIFIKEHNVDKPGKDVYRDKYCKIVGIADFRDYIANNSIHMSIDALRESAIMSGRASSVFVRLRDDKVVDPDNLKEFQPGGTTAEVKHWMDRDDYGTDDLVKGFNIISIITFTVSIICAAILVAFVVFYNTQKKRRTTGILRAIGMRARVFFILFTMEGIFFALIGVGVGTAISYGIELYMRKHPIVMPFGDLYPMFETHSYIYATILFVGVSFIASVYYAFKSSRENIIKIVRGD